jgi:hypothetical protein
MRRKVDGCEIGLEKPSFARGCGRCRELYALAINFTIAVLHVAIDYYPLLVQRGKE